MSELWMEVVVGEYHGDRAGIVHANAVFRERLDEEIDGHVANAVHRHGRLAQTPLRGVRIDAELVPEGELRRGAASLARRTLTVPLRWRNDRPN